MDGTGGEGEADTAGVAVVPSVRARPAGSLVEARGSGA